MQKVLFSCFGRGVLLSCLGQGICSTAPGNTKCAPPWLSTGCRITAVLCLGAEPLQRFRRLWLTALNRWLSTE